MKSSAKFLFGLGLAGLCVLAAPATTHANLQLTLTVTQGSNAPMSESTSTNSGGTITALIFNNTQINTGNNSSFTLNFGGFTIPSLTAASDLTARSLQVNPFSVTNNNTNAATLSIILSDDGMTTPITTGLNLTSLASLNANSGTVTFQSFVGNILNDTNGVHTTPQTFSATSTPPPSTTASNFASPGQPFSITNIATFTLPGVGSGTSHTSAGTVTNFGGTSTVSTPEPATLATVLAGAPVAGLFFWRRRRAKAAVQA